MIETDNGEAPNVVERALANTQIALLHDALGELAKTAPSLHAVLVAHDVDEVPMDQIAAAGGIRLKTAWNRLRLARAALRAIVRRLGAQGRLVR